MNIFSRACLLLVILTLSAGCATTGKQDKVSTRAAETNTQLGIQYMRDGKLDVALRKFQKALAQDPDLPGAHDGIAVLYTRTGENKLAEKHYKRSLRLDAKNSRAHNNYGQFLCAQERYDEAEKEFETAAKNPYYTVPALPLSNAGMCARRIPDEARAEKYFRKALEHDAEFGPALLQMADISYSKNNYLSARAYLQRYQAAAKHNPESLWLGVRTEYALGDNQAWGKYSMMLKNNFPNARQTKRLQEWESERQRR